MNAEAARIQVQINGELTETAGDMSLLALLHELRLQPVGIMIERNGEALLRSEWPDIRVAAGDQYEILRVVAGG